MADELIEQFIKDTGDLAVAIRAYGEKWENSADDLLDNMTDDQKARFTLVQMAVERLLDT